MNNSDVAKNGFKTFLLTLTLSLVLFSIVYYLATDTAPRVDIEAESAATFTEPTPVPTATIVPTVIPTAVPTVTPAEAVTSDFPQEALNNTEDLIAAAPVQAQPVETMKAPVGAPASAFGSLSKEQLDVEPQKVLGAGDINETTQSTVPATATMSVTYAFIIAVITALTGLYLAVSSKKKALVSFENRVKRD